VYYERRRMSKEEVMTYFKRASRICLKGLRKQENPAETLHKKLLNHVCKV
jgi:hypothetical protein